MEGGKVFFKDNISFTNYLNVRRGNGRGVYSWEMEMYYLYKSDTEIYIEKRYGIKPNEIEYYGKTYVVEAILHIDLVNKKIKQLSHFLNCWNCPALLKKLGVEFLDDPSLHSNKNRSIYLTFRDFMGAIFGEFKSPNDIIKNRLLHNNIEFENFPINDLRRLLEKDCEIWRNKVSNYNCIFSYLALSTNPHTFIKNVKKLKKMVVIDMFGEANILNRKVNMSWSVERMKLEHATMSRIIRDERMKSEDNAFLNSDIPYPILTNAEIINSKFGLIDEGAEMNHCVGGYGYWNSCVNGTSVIYKYYSKEDKLRATLQLQIIKNKGKYQFIPVQFYSRNNRNVNHKWWLLVEEELVEHNKNLELIHE